MGGSVMATQKTKDTLLESKEWGQLEVSEMRLRLATFIADWYDLAQRLDTVNNVRFTARLRTYSAKSGVSAGELLEILLPVARAIYEQGRVPAVPEPEPVVVAPESPEPEPTLKPVRRARSKSLSKVGTM